LNYQQILRNNLHAFTCDNSPPRPKARWRAAFNQLLPRQKLTQHILQNPAVLVVFHFDFVVECGNLPETLELDDAFAHEATRVKSAGFAHNPMLVGGRFLRWSHS
jgi:hypothetical protein